MSHLDIRTSNTKASQLYSATKIHKDKVLTRNGSHKENSARRMAPAETIGSRAQLGVLSKMGKIEEHCRTSRPANGVERNRVQQCNHMHCAAGVMDIG